MLLLLLVLLACRGEHRSRRSTIALVPIGAVPADLLAHLQGELQAILKRDVIIAAPIAPPDAALDAARHQYRGSALLEELGAMTWPVPIGWSGSSTPMRTRRASTSSSGRP